MLLRADGPSAPINQSPPSSWSGLSARYSVFLVDCGENEKDDEPACESRCCAIKYQPGDDFLAAIRHDFCSFLGSLLGGWLGRLSAGGGRSSVMVNGKSDQWDGSGSLMLLAAMTRAINRRDAGCDVLARRVVQTIGSRQRRGGVASNPQRRRCGRASFAGR